MNGTREAVVDDYAIKWVNRIWMVMVCRFFIIKQIVWTRTVEQCIFVYPTHTNHRMLMEMVMQKSRNIHATWGNDQIRSSGLGEDDYTKQHIVMLSHPGPPVCGLLCFLLLWTEAYLLLCFNFGRSSKLRASSSFLIYYGVYHYLCHNICSI